MDQRDRELLDKQVRHIQPDPGRDGVTIAAIIAVFFVGVTFGSLLFPPHEPVRLAANDAAAETAQIQMGAPTSR